MASEITTNCHCHCGETRFTVRTAPLLRGFCHCTICQAFNQQPYADISVYRARDVDRPDDGGIDFHAYRAPRVLQRGKCKACGAPAIEYLRLPLMPELIIVPTANIADPACVVPPQLHIFYDRRVADIEDGLPKYNGYPKSQFAFGRRILAAL